MVKKALAKDSSLRACLDNIYILVNDGVVIMAGSVTQESLKTLAQKIVSSVPGVNIVIDDLKVEPSQPHRVGVQIDWAKGRMALL
ncbi:MAG TPA: BON domain-containing protein [Chryseosolibacter sp.]